MNDPIMLGCFVFALLCILWYLWMWTFRTQDMAIIVKAHEDAKNACSTTHEQGPRVV
ncbi:MAG: hypothetical protein U0800_12510 [Isosphaeraceae bacterium]